MPATPVNITSLSRAGNVVTVGATAHGLVVGQAAWIQGVNADTSFNGIYVVASATANSFTFNQNGANANPVVSGTVSPAKQWIAEQLDNSQGGELNILVEFWFPVSSGNELPNGSGSGFTRLVPDETSAISAGRIFVQGRTLCFPNNYSGAQMQAFINLLYTQKLAFRNSTVYIGQYYGYFSDGTATLGRA